MIPKDGQNGGGKSTYGWNPPSMPETNETPNRRNPPRHKQKQQSRISNTMITVHKGLLPFLGESGEMMSSFEGV
jgi:hypothetical protein